MPFSLTRILQRAHTKYLNAPWEFGKATSQKVIDLIDPWDNFQIQDINFSLNSSNYIDRYILKHGYFDPLLEKALSSPSSADAFLDVGANFGYFSLLAARNGYRVLAIEPSPRELAKLYHNLTLNPDLISHVQIFPFALGDKSTQLAFKLADESNAGQNHVVGDSSTTDGETITINVRTLIDAITDKQLEEIKFVKVDVEGFEGEAIASLKPLLQSTDEMALYIEFTPKYIEERSNWTIPDIQRAIAKSGFRSVAKRGDERQWDELFIKGNFPIPIPTSDQAHNESPSI